MGYLTTITFYNDAASTLREHPEVVSQGIYNAQSGVQLNRGSDTFSVGNHCNPVILQRPRHADDHTLYLHAGNTLVEASDAEKNQWACNAFIAEMKFRLKQLQKVKKENNW